MLKLLKKSFLEYDFLFLNGLASLTNTLHNRASVNTSAYFRGFQNCYW